MPRLAYKANGDYDKLLEYAQENMRKCIDVFKVKKMWMDAAVKNGTLPFATQRPRDINGKQGPPLVDFSELVYVIGVVGINEMVQHFTGKQLHESADAVKLAVRLLIDMEKYRKGLQMKTGMKLSLARTPAESTAQTFAVQDLMSEFKPMARNTIKGDLSYLDKVNGRDIPLYYTNGTHINVSANIPLAQKMDIEQKFFPILSGGNIFQVWMGENNSDPEGLYHLTKKIVNNSQIGYFAYTKDLTICSDCNSTSGGLLDICPVCNSKNVKNWSRITGYYSDVSGWNSAKKQELRDRFKMKL
jgi:ribonucleoside-triphosphate reductase